MPYLVCYDIENDNRRLKTAAKLIEFGFQRVQKSVFAGDPGETALQQLEAWLQKHFPAGANNEDTALLLPCTQRQLETTKVFGQDPPDWHLLTDPPNTLII